MFDLSYLEHEINEWKRETYSEYGKKLEIAYTMLKDELAYLQRLKRVRKRIELKINVTKGRKKKFYKKMLEKNSEKITQAERKMEKLRKIVHRYKEEFIQYRETLGLTDHSFINEIFKEI